MEKQKSTTPKPNPLQSKLDEALATIAAQEEVIVAQAAQLGQQAKAGAKGGGKPVAFVPADTFTVDGAEYRFILPQFRCEFGFFTATQALENQEVLNHLVAIGAGVIQKI